MQRTKSAKKTKVQEAASTIVPRSKKATPRRGLLPSGSTLLNCALSDDYTGGMGAGKIVNIVGESSAGKTMIVETMLAEMANDPQYDNYDLYLDDSEHALEMDIEGLFGRKAAKRIQAPSYDDDGEPIYSDTVEQWFATVLGLIKKAEDSSRPFVYCLDSLDTLSDSAEMELAQDLLKRSEKVKDQRESTELAMAGSYGMAKAKLMSQTLRTIKKGLAETNSTLIIISQVRDNANARPGQSTKRRSGGKALDFYCTHIVWLAAVKTHKAGKSGNEEIVGRQVEAKVSKNKLTGKVRTVKFDIYYDYGVDDLGSCIDFLATYNVLKKKGGYLDASVLGFEKSLTKNQLINAVEDDAEALADIKRLVGETWTDKEESLSLGRKPRFS